jgi:hypothetical protein
MQFLHKIIAFLKIFFNILKQFFQNVLRNISFWPTLAEKNKTKSFANNKN